LGVTEAAAVQSRRRFSENSHQTKNQIIMNPINIEEIKQQLGEFAKAYQRPLRGKTAILSPLRDELLTLDAKGATSGEIAVRLSQYQITVSKDTVARFLRIEKQKDRKKPAAASARKMMMPRHLSPVEKP
jgi:hypothetical protein